MGYGSRTEMARLAKAGGIVLDGVEVADVGQRVALTPDLPARMVIDGAALDPLQGLVMLLNKPLGMTCSHKEEGPLVYDILPRRWRARDPAISTVGRLDKQTSGLLLLTDDGDLLHRIISPRRHVRKTYRARLARPLTGGEGAVFASGTGENDSLRINLATEFSQGLFLRLLPHQSGSLLVGNIKPLRTSSVFDLLQLQITRINICG